MPYTFYRPYVDGLAQTPKEDWTDDFQAFIDDTFYNASDVFTIKEETTFADVSRDMTDIDVRINYAFSPTTGTNMGDDWKIIMFKDTTKTVNYGAYFYFDDSWWIAVNTETIKNLTATCIVRRCNNTLRWRDVDGAYYDEPCILDYRIQENRDYASAVSAVVNPSGILVVISQLNTNTNKIRANQRFLFGNTDNWTAYKVFGGGIHNFNNIIGQSNVVKGLLTMTMGVNYVNDQLDDLTNGIADISEFVYTIEIEGALTGEVGTQSQLTGNVFLNGNYDSSLSVTWSSDDDSIATVSSSGLVDFVAEGTTQICAILTGNSSIETCETVETTLVAPNEYTIQIDPADNYVLEGRTQNFEVGLYLDGVLQVDTFTFNLTANTVPSDSYVFTAVDGNNFTIQNVDMYLEDTLDVECVSGVNTRTFSFTLRGAW